MAYREATGNGYNDQQNLSGWRAEGREPGARRKKLAGYLKAANELRQSYTQSWNARETSEEVDSDMPGAFPDAAVVRSGSEEMILFPSYARNHIREKPRAEPGTIQQVSGSGRDYRDTTGAGDAEFWREQWEKYEDDTAIVDVDVRGWIYSPHKGPMSRKHRLMVGLARQLVGIPAPTATKSSPSSSGVNSRSSSPTRSAHRERAEARAARNEEELVSQEAEAIIRRGEAEADIAGLGGFSEPPSKASDNTSVYSARSRSGSPLPMSRQTTLDSSQSGESDWVSPVQKRASWPVPAKMSPAELAVANSHLMARLKPFMANPLANTPISAFFYNDKVSRQRTINTDASGHFSFRAALDFIPTHVRILASEKLSATEEVRVTKPRGVSLISDIDDTIKHSAITAGAREIFRNAFIRDLADLTIQGVREWYNKLADMGVKFHYVSNSPYQLYPVLTSFFSHAGLPKGTFHLKQYTGMFQGIFEPVAERKKSTLDKLMRDFPERKWILVGDSGEADLEVYTDVVMEYPNRILGIFIRDVTTPPDKGFFDSAMGPLSGERSPKFHKRNQSTDSLSGAKRFSRPDDIQDDDEELRKAIAESLKEMEEQAAKDRRSVFSDTPATTRFQDPDRKEARPMLPPRQTTEPAAPRSQAMESLGDLIDFSDDEASPSLGVQQAKPSRTGRPAPPAQLHKAASFAEPHTATPPRRPVKPMNLRSPSNEGATAHAPAPAPNATIPRPQPPKPRKPSTTVNPITPSPLSQVQANSPLATQRPALPERPTTYRAAAKQKLATAYNALPSASAYWHGAPSTQPTGPPRPTFASEDAGFAPSPRSVSTVNTRSTDELYPRGGQAVAGSSSRREAPPAPPPRRNLSAYPAAAASYATNRLSGGNWDGSSGGNGNNVNAGNVGQPINKREEAWKRRWARSKEIMEHRGVLLRTWRVGEDVMEQCTQLVEKALREMEAETGKQADRGQAEPNGVADRGRRSR